MTSLRFDRVKTPHNDGELLIEPPASFVGELLQDNSARLAADYDLGGMTLGNLRRQARRELYRAAREYTLAYRSMDTSPSVDATTKPLFLAGHQPELFHPGVWVKNFVLAKLAELHGGVAINLVIDSDLAKQTALRVPSGSLQQPRWETINFAPQRPAIAYDQYNIDPGGPDWGQLTSFGDRVQAAISSLYKSPQQDPAVPLVADFWPLAVERIRATGKLGLGLAQARHCFEQVLGIETLEIPQSLVSRLPCFAWFAVHLLVNTSRLHDIYNASLREYRARYRVRNSAHPAPDLAQQEDWQETPFWMWTNTDTHRRPLYAKLAAGRLELTDCLQFHRVLSCPSISDLAATVEQFSRLTEEDFDIHTRALTTTLFARLVLGDLFMHGIGGAKYDRATDLLFTRYFHVNAPHYLAVSGTKRLPLALDLPPVGAIASTRQQLRSLKYHPDVHLRINNDASRADESAIADLIARKHDWIETSPTPELSKRRWREIREVNRQLQPFIQERCESLVRQLDSLRERERLASMLGARDFSFVLYPKKTLAEFLRDSVLASL